MSMFSSGFLFVAESGYRFFVPDQDDEIGRAIVDLRVTHFVGYVAVAYLSTTVLLLMTLESRGVLELPFEFHRYGMVAILFAIYIAVYKYGEKLLISLGGIERVVSEKRPDRTVSAYDPMWLAIAAWLAYPTTAIVCGIVFFVPTGGHG